jgi:hypothetical protein
MLVIVAVIAIFLAMIDFGAPPAAKRKAMQLNCFNNLKQIGLSFRLWSGDHFDKYPMLTRLGGFEWVNCASD